MMTSLCNDDVFLVRTNHHVWGHVITFLSAGKYSLEMKFLQFGVAAAFVLDNECP